MRVVSNNVGKTNRILVWALIRELSDHGLFGGQNSIGMFYRPTLQLLDSRMLHLSTTTNSENKLNKLSSPELVVKRNLTYIEHMDFLVNSILFMDPLSIKLKFINEM